ncbi:hypothetical protein HMPREF1990_01586 [Porphyromonas gingivalis W4087]|nr:hypothetical protein HMPREF1990_01586 [Porphyromonas gingivalis W4087]
MSVNFFSTRHRSQQFIKRNNRPGRKKFFLQYGKVEKLYCNSLFKGFGYINEAFGYVFKGFGYISETFG